MDSLPNLLKECCPDSAIAKQLQCGRTKSTQLIDKISQQGRKTVIFALRNKKFSLIVDETTDVSSKKCIVLVARYVDDGQVRDRFVALLEVQNADAISLFNLIKEFFNQHNIPFKNMIGLATDGASVMAGNIGGLRALLQAETNLFFLKCTCHSLHLCSSYAFKKLPNTLETLCRNIYSYFSHSPKRITELQEFQKYCAVEPHKILGISNTRWLSLETVISRIVEQWDSLRLYFISCTLEVTGIRATCLAEKMNKSSKIYFLFLTYILPIINNLNKEFQSERSRLPYLYSSIKTTFLLILSNFVQKKYIDNNLILDYANINTHLEIEGIFIGAKAELFLKNNFNGDEIFSVKANIVQFYIEFLNQVKKRFDFDRADLQFLKLITPPEALSENDKSILPLLSEFGKLFECDIDKIVSQWHLLRLSDHNLNSQMEIDVFWKNVGNIKNGLNENIFKDLVEFVHNLMSLPHSSAAAERKFSTLALVKTKLRNRLELCSLNNIMMCKEMINKTDSHYIWSAKHDFK